MAIDPKSMDPEDLVARILDEAEEPNITVPFPMYKPDGNPVCDVVIKTVPVAKETKALAEASRKFRKMQADRDHVLGDEELLANCRAVEILAMACFRPDDPNKPFFRHAAVDVEKFNSEVLGQLMTAYAGLKQHAWPTLAQMSAAEIETWIDVISTGVASDPLSGFSRASLEAFCISLVHLVVSVRETERSSSTPEQSDAPSE